ncbi:MAG: hypothetical protein P1U74_11430 [Legionellaceae bacterium]|nr:hypothetical protein [Legionellaceae bacterium]
MLTNIDHDWALVQLAFAYQQKINNDITAVEKACTITSEVIARHKYQDSLQSRKILAFAYCTQANSSSSLVVSINNYEAGLALYEKFYSLSNIHYLQSKHQYAVVLYNSRDKYSAKMHFEQLDALWQERGDWPVNIYAGNFSAAYALFLGNLGQVFEALEQLYIAEPILKRTSPNSTNYDEVVQDISRLESVLSQREQRPNTPNP